MVEYLYRNHSTFLARALPVVVAIGVGIVIDVLVLVFRRMKDEAYERQKSVYDATVFGMNHLLRNLLALLNNSSDEVVEILEKLQDLRDLDLEVIRYISRSNAGKHWEVSTTVQVYSGKSLPAGEMDFS